MLSSEELTKYLRGIVSSCTDPDQASETIMNNFRVVCKHARVIQSKDDGKFYCHLCGGEVKVTLIK